jgi:hypothetical protein
MRGWLVILAAVAACAEQAPPPGAGPDATPAAAPAAAAYGTIVKIDARVDSIDAYLAVHPRELRVFARLPDSTVVPVKDSTSFPDETEESYNVLRDSAGRVLLHRRMPTSESGDWFEVDTHYFAPDGHTIRYDFRISSFSGGCDVLREQRRYWYGPAFALLRQDSTYTDKNDQPIDARECYRRGDDPTPASRRSADLPGTQ